MTELLHVLRVFTDSDGRYGNPLGVFLRGWRIPTDQRQRLAAELAFSETVFVDDLLLGKIRLFGPTAPLPFAGHPLVGTAWLIDAIGLEPTTLHPPAGDVPVWHEDGLTWIRGRPEWCPPWAHVRAADADLVAAATSAPDGHDAVQVWAFSDEVAGRVRARVFAPRFGVDHDEACGSATQLLCAELQRPLTVDHGDGSVIHVRPGPDGTVDLGGAVVVTETRQVSV